MLIAFVVVAIVFGAQALGNNLTPLFTRVGTTFSTIPTPVGVAFHSVWATDASANFGNSGMATLRR